MGHDWILSVLSDLKTYAEQNGLPSLAEQLSDTAVVARAEIASQSEGTGLIAKGDVGKSGSLSREVGFG